MCKDQIENLLGYNDKELNITYNRSLKEFTKGWLLAHGDESRLFSMAGATALNLAIKTNKSVIASHTHRQGIMRQSYGFGGKQTTLTGVEVGHLCDIKTVVGAGNPLAELLPQGSALALL